MAELAPLVARLSSCSTRRRSSASQKSERSKRRRGLQEGDKAAMRVHLHSPGAETDQDHRPRPHTRVSEKTTTIIFSPAEDLEQAKGVRAQRNQQTPASRGCDSRTGESGEVCMTRGERDGFSCIYTNDLAVERLFVRYQLLMWTAFS